MNMVHSLLQSCIDSLDSRLYLYNASLLQLLFALAAIVVAGAGFKYVFIGGEDESPIPINVPVPEQVKPGWTGEVLDHPEIKVRQTLPGAESPIS